MVELTVNGQTRSVDADPDTPLLYVLRDHLELNAAKNGCGLGQCGACTVMVDGEAVYSCVTPILLLEGRKVTTLEGLGTIEQPAPNWRGQGQRQTPARGHRGLRQSGNVRSQAPKTPANSGLSLRLTPRLGPNARPCSSPA
jgi:nicotinate dehydrogenase subunit A